MNEHMVNDREKTLSLKEPRNEIRHADWRYKIL